MNQLGFPHCGSRQVYCQLCQITCEDTDKRNSFWGECHPQSKIPKGTLSELPNDPNAKVKTKQIYVNTYFKVS